MTEGEREAIVRELEQYINCDMREQPQSVLFRSGVNTGIRIAIRTVKEFTGEGVKDED